MPNINFSNFKILAMDFKPRIVIAHKPTEVKGGLKAKNSKDITDEVVIAVMEYMNAVQKDGIGVFKVVGLGELTFKREEVANAERKF